MPVLDRFSTEVQEQILNWSHDLYNDETHANYDDPTLIIVEWNEANLANRNLNKNTMIAGMFDKNNSNLFIFFLCLS
jgi:hypothetical protein